ncbi:MAG TPA: carboxypeptidase-like regulatory domain-containing protein [Planctomycetota bacterium]|nr:carboxypeptidase-like regulatory domain-containing protein [Planctomycetota bacterium]
MPGAKSIAQIAPSVKPAPKRGGSALALLLILALAAALALVWWRAARAGAVPQDVDASSSDAASNEGSRPPAPLDPDPMGVRSPLEVGRSERIPRTAAQPFDPARLEGKGHIRGFVQAPPGIEFPQEWTLYVLPSSSLIGKDKAETRKLEFHAGEQEFDLEDLALGGYMLRAVTFGLSSDEQHMLLAKPGETELYVILQLGVTSFIEGSVRYDDSTPAVGLTLALEPRAGGARVIANSDPIGHFLFTDVKSGAYTLHFGKPESPVREPIAVNMGTSPEHLPDAIVPKLGELYVRAFYDAATPAKGVKLDGYGEHGGRIEGETDENGEYRATFLPPGTFTVNALFPDGTRARGKKIVQVGELDLLELVHGK